MLKIGEFSKLSRISVRMLRYYDEIGLLKPAKIDNFTDYRYYNENQLPIICRITELKNMGFSLTEINQMLLDYEDKDTINKFLDNKIAELEKLSNEIKNKLTLLDIAKTKLRKDDIMNYNITIKTIPERYAATVHTIIPKYEDEGMVWGILCEETKSMNLIPDEPCLCAVTFCDAEYKEKDVEVEAWKTVKGNYSDTENVKFRTLPEVTVASCTFMGSYEQMGYVYANMVSWIKENGYDFAGPMFNIYHVSPYETEDSSQFVTEVCYPVIKK